MFFKSGPDLVSLLPSLAGSCYQFLVCWSSLSLSSPPRNHACRNPSSSSIIAPAGLDAPKTCLFHASAVSAALAQLHLLLLIQIDLPRLALTVSSCVSAINNPWDRFFPATSQLGDSLCVPFPLFSTSAVALTLAVSLYPTLVLVSLLPS